MNGFKAYRYHLALKLHFTSEKYNVFENRGNIKVSLDAYKNRNDHFLFEKLSRKFDSDQEYIQYIVSNYAYDNANFLYNESIAESNFTRWIKVKESITKTFTDDINTILYEADKHNIGNISKINCTNNDIPFIIKLYLANQIQPQTISILNDFTNMIDNWQSDSTMSMLFQNNMVRLKKIKGFFSYDKEKLEKIYESHKSEL